MYFNEVEDETYIKLCSSNVMITAKKKKMKKKNLRL